MPRSRPPSATRSSPATASIRRGRRRTHGYAWRMADTEPSVDAREVLEGERATLMGQLADLGVATYDENFADSGQVAAEQGENRALVNQLADTLADVERALAKLDEGSYGACESCG